MAGWRRGDGRRGGLRQLGGALKFQVLHDRPDERRRAVAVERAEGEHRRIEIQLVAEAGGERGNLRRALFFRPLVDFVQHQPALSLGGVGIVGFVVANQFVFDDGDGFDRIDLIERRDIDDMQQQVRARQMPEELVPQPRAFGGAFDQPGNVRHHEAAVRLGCDHAQIGVQGGEGVIRHLRFGLRYRANQGGFAGVRHAQQAHIRQDTQFQQQPAFFAGGAFGFLPRRAVGRALEAGIAEAVPAALGDHQRGFCGDDFADDFAGIQIVHHGAERHAHK